MAHAIPALPCVVLLLVGCAPDSAPPAGPGAEPEAIPIVPGALTVRSPAAPIEGAAGVESVVFELGCGSNGKLALSLWDRKGRESGPETRLLLGPTGRDVRAGERLTLRFDWSVREGEEVLSEFVRPIGGEEAMDAVEAAVPGFRSARVATVRFVTSGGGTGRVSTRFCDGAVPLSSGFRTFALPLGAGVAEVAAGEPAVLFASAWVGEEGFARPDAPPPGRITDGGHGFASGADTVDASRHPGPFWSLRVTLEPDTRR